MLILEPRALHLLTRVSLCVCVLCSGCCVLQSDGYTNYDMNSLEAGKATCKAALQRELGLPVDPTVPLLGFIGGCMYMVCTCAVSQ